MPTTTTTTTQCQLSFHMRVHGKATDKAVTIGKEAAHTGHLLTPLGGVAPQQEEHQKLLLKLQAHPATYGVDHAGPLDEPDFRTAAAKYVATHLAGYGISNVAAIPSKWNPTYHRWDPPGASELAFGYVLQKDDGSAVGTFCTAGVQTVFVDFVIHLQKNA